MRTSFQQRMSALSLVVLVGVVACGATSGPAAPPPPSLDPPDAASRAVEPGDAGVDALPPADAQPDEEASQSPCPADMIYVEHDYCPNMQRRCSRSEYNRPNHITICHAFDEGSSKCLAPREHLAFCVDKYEYPNREGGHPPWMVSWYDAEATCRSLGKRTCFDSEWVAACEGPEETPFPYGWQRDNTKCNIDNLWLEPRLSAAYSKDRETADRELARLDQSVPSGAMPGCVSGYGVHDLTGNMDEWVTRADARDGKKSKWAGLKGGAWGHVRNACRPMTTSHPPEFTYYFITFRCCKDPAGRDPYAPSNSSPPVVEPADRAPVPNPVNPIGPSAKKVQSRTVGH